LGSEGVPARQAPRFESRALDVITVDEKQDDEYGQNTRDTYPLADFFANLGIPSGKYAVGRFIENDF
jgi:hypothetical protein